MQRRGKGGKEEEETARDEANGLKKGGDSVEEMTPEFPFSLNRGKRYTY